MRVTTSVTLPITLLEEIDRVDSNHSAFLEKAAVSYLARRANAERDGLLDASETAILNRMAEERNGQSAVLDFQGLPE